MTRPLVGVHVSIGGSIDLAVDRAVKLGCGTFQIFTRNPRGWKFSELPAGPAEAFRAKLKEAGISVVVSHMPYLPNLACPDEEIYSKSVEALTAELRRAEVLGLKHVVAHLGSHMGKGIGYGQERLAAAVRKAYDQSGSRVSLLLENMAGQKNAVGSSFADLARIMELAGGDLGVCLDTCHAYAAGYDLAGEEGVASTLAEFDREVGLGRLKALHLNDSKGPLGSRLDRHENIGMGGIGAKGFRALLSRKEVRGLPMILETPVGNEEDYRRDMKAVLDLLAAT